MTKPTFITFTGLDERTDLVRAKWIAVTWPVEFAVLLSRSRQGEDPRYPDIETLSAIWWTNFPRLAAHVCGGYGEDIVAGRSVHDVPVDLGYCKRVQVNHLHPDAEAIRKFAAGWGVRGIGQTSGTHPADTQIDWLFDLSRGAGRQPEAWPAHPGGQRIVGYAGGITPDNVSTVVQAIRGDGPFWLDMESGVRTDNWLDLDKCEQVCRLAFDGQVPR